MIMQDGSHYTIVPFSFKLLHKTLHTPPRRPRRIIRRRRLYMPFSYAGHISDGHYLLLP